MPANTDPGSIRIEPSVSGAKVYCVLCLDDVDVDWDPVHVFSSKEQAEAYADQDTARRHIFYDYVIDCPERMEGRTQ